MEAPSQNNFRKYLQNFILKYSYALFPLFVLLSWWNWFAFACGFLLLISVLYSGYQKHVRIAAGAYEINATPKGTDILYFILVGGFLSLSFLAVLFGLLKLFDNSSDLETLMVVLYALLINCILFFITYLMKNRLNTGFLVVGVLSFLVIDFCAVFPFNYLFFYEKFQMNADIDRKKIIATDIYKVLNKRNNDTLGKYETIVRNDTVIKRIISEDFSDAFKKQKELDTMILIDTNNRKHYERIKSEIQKRVENQNKKTQKSSGVPMINASIYTTAKSLEEELSIANNNFNDSINKTSNPAVKLKLINNFFNTITRLLAISDTDTLLGKKITEYNAEPKSQLTKVLDVYTFVWSKVWDTDGKQQNWKDDKLTVLALTVSLLIDLLPLLICLLYIFFRRID